jgi:hypothetical protein
MFDRTAADGNIWANLRARSVQGYEFVSHLYIEYVDKRGPMRRVFEAEPDFTPHLPSPYGYLYGMAPRPWGSSYVKGDDPGAPYVPDYPAEESEDDASSPLIGVSLDTYACLNRKRGSYNAQHILYNKYNNGGQNSNWWAVNVCSACQLSFPLGVPAFMLSAPMWTPISAGV